MNKHHPYNNIIERKLEQLPAANADHLWNDMHSILDKAMPEKKERRRFIFWFLNGKGLFMMSFALLIIVASSLYFVSEKQKPVIANNQLPVSSQRDKSTGDVSVKASPGTKEKTFVVNESNQQNNSDIPTNTLLPINNDEIATYNFKASKTSKEPKKKITEIQFNEPGQTVVKTRSDFDRVMPDLKLNHKDFHISANNKQIDSLIRSAVLKTNKPKQNPAIQNENGFYAGIISGVDLSSIGFRSARAGSTKGFIVGYALNNKWSIESGLLWDTKRVYDDGNSFNPSGYTPLSGVTITAVNGRSRLYEWPVSIKYTIATGKNKLFATTGLSSYFMKSENYDYEYTQNGQPGGHNYLSYTNGSKNWFSVANLSVGYARKIGNTVSFRAEPYIKLPLKNLGVGNMPIISTGLNIGITKTIK